MDSRLVCCLPATYLRHIWETKELLKTDGFFSDRQKNWWKLMNIRLNGDLRPAHELLTVRLPLDSPPTAVEVPFGRQTHARLSAGVISKSMEVCTRATILPSISSSVVLFGISTDGMDGLILVSWHTSDILRVTNNSINQLAFENI